MCANRRPPAVRILDLGQRTMTIRLIAIRYTSFR